MNKRKVTAAARRAGYEVLSTWSGWIPNTGENVRQYEVTFQPIGGEEDQETEEFESASHAVEYFQILEEETLAGKGKSKNVE